MIQPGWYRSLDTRSRRAFWSSFGGFSIDAMSVQLFAFVLPVLIGMWSMTPGGAGLLASAALFSGSIGGWLAGSLSDRVGRVQVLRVTIVWLGVSSVFCGLAQNFEQFLLARLVQGFGFGAEWAVGVVFMSEMSPARTRGRTLGSLQSAWAVGWGLAATGAFLSLALLPPEPGWRIVFFVGLLPAAGLAFVRWRLPESRIFSAAVKRQPWHDIFARDMVVTTIKGSLLATGTHGGYWAIATWWPTMLRVERGMSPGETVQHTAALIVGSLVGYMLAAWLSDRIGRKATLASFAMLGAATALVATQLQLSDAWLLALTPILGLFALGIYSAIGPVLTELYPTSLRGSGMGFCYNVGRGLAGATPFAVGGTVAALGYAHAIGLYVAASYLVILVTTTMIEETRGVTLSSDSGEVSPDGSGATGAFEGVRSPAL
jgi:MFS family permease